MSTKICKFYKCDDEAMRFHPSGYCFQCYQNDPKIISSNRKRLKVLDLFSGLGGFSEAFYLNHDEVLRIENNPLLSSVPGTEMMDVLKLRDLIKSSLEEGDLLPHLLQLDVILASPPCYDFSLAYSAPQAIASRNGEFDSYAPDMELVEATLEIIEILKPRYFIIENVRGSIRHFEKIGLTPTMKHQAYVFYGKFPKFSIPKLESKAKKGNRIAHGNPLRANHRALIPLPVSESLRNAILDQKSIFDYMGDEE